MKNNLKDRMKTVIIFITMTLATAPAFTQHSGNSVIGQYFNQSATGLQGADKLYLSDTTFIIQANVMMNVIAGSYVATFGVAESSPTLGEANSKIDKRINSFIAALKKLGIAQQDIYVDMTTQTQIFDYKVNGDYAEQYIAGFEQKKNVIVKFKNINDLDKMLVAASENGIYDLAKVDYIVTDPGRIYEQLFQSALEVINRKKELYVKATGMKLSPSSQVYGESFYSLYPEQLYKSYTPNLSAQYYDYSTYSKKKELRKSTTYYYDNISYSGFDKVIHPIVTEPAVEFVLTLQIKFQVAAK